MNFDYDWCNLQAERQIDNSNVKIEIRKTLNLN